MALSSQTNSINCIHENKKGEKSCQRELKQRHW